MGEAPEIPAATKASGARGGVMTDIMA
jgi:hypothetical protein